jgi:ubiquinone/menaquinone biosynthesis C-methylase UbiE
MKTPIKEKLGNSEREKYWNEDYVSYWRARVDEANSSKIQTSRLVAGDAKTSSDELYMNAIGLLKVAGSDNVLELGCGFGRSLSALCRAALQVAAVDISEQMIAVAKKACREKNVSFHVSPSEELPFPGESFDVVVCFAAFDAMYQTEALIEMNRVCKKGGRILITGKNDNYHDDDVAALEAEVGARAKNHPNYFTDAGKLIRNVEKFGFYVEVQKYYSRRGDFAMEMATERMPEMFYEYLFVLNKIAESSATEDFVVADKVSKTYAKRGLLA